ncbi:RraA family protein [Oceanobacillus neutriphilus]|uniref:Putative 4-hydroxy-4-methyl-2-oxoglutarate aldolase n=1 Tax=Oceanobacillus neutriphilus TaxID=531815 RepID=A0ABQ2P1C4_9BACI|nr:RraA family protein [Oceanobacillus neutriphilus]GGP15822.1 methyltransferase [Oceanobacillus neutriphilus]
MSGIGMRILPIKERAPKELIEAFTGIGTSIVSDNMARLHGCPNLAFPFQTRKKLIGSAFTVKTRPGDNLLIHKALDLAAPGDVLIVDAGGDTTNALIGEIMLKMALKNGIKGLVTNGAIRDSDAFRDSEFTVYAKGVTHLGPYKDGPGEINVPVNIDGMIVNPGDIILGDGDGVISIPLEQSREILEVAKDKMEKEEASLKQLDNGTYNHGWVDEILKSKGYKLEE